MDEEKCYAGYNDCDCKEKMKAIYKADKHLKMIKKVYKDVGITFDKGATQTDQKLGFYSKSIGVKAVVKSTPPINSAGLCNIADDDCPQYIGLKDQEFRIAEAGEYTTVQTDFPLMATGEATTSPQGISLIDAGVEMLNTGPKLIADKGLSGICETKDGTTFVSDTNPFKENVTPYQLTAIQGLRQCPTCGWDKIVVMELDGEVVDYAPVRIAQWSHPFGTLESTRPIKALDYQICFGCGSLVAQFKTSMGQVVDDFNRRAIEEGNKIKGETK